jgi:hypothetical protein
MVNYPEHVRFQVLKAASMMFRIFIIILSIFTNVFMNYYFVWRSY